MIDAVPADCVTPIATVVGVYSLLLDDNDRNGQVIECSGDEYFVLPDPPLANGHKTERACLVYGKWYSSLLYLCRPSRA